ncbi:PQQ-dependent catabolism-associated CXXCW motif protein [Cereibacter sphaeroides]|uniref:PQQ-dependent catabolism-associated CXXCW motif protein n=1 Tax=Cereibacter sphaeroides TaxID=1063 RepID=UPI001F3B0BDB|nr:PQQ-dependent catabolism-associated CXXCW motif protein [Cereibacter sphaeroides]MCE6961575.1 PQQ-dependent catabolism-associated CXXCW motif protein [Cereibacter sphaeroides]MCE6968163.1 PQQ-dependent catabolism-associated CXXCW motif protein [Cereibacter sphaeroides]MCE6974925.1 PQQ-dependent catabolism-associated CXXCW motif protein [Cereibacter sphaeroides]
MRAAVALLLSLALAGPATAEVPEPEGFRGPPYREAVPATVLGRAGIAAEEARALHDRGVPFVDVLPREAKPEGLPEGTVWREKPHQSIPGAIWLPNTGYEALAPAEEAYLRKGLERVTRGQPLAEVVIFCKRDCWMSWNAAKRAIGWGFTGIHWFPGGVEAWQDLGGDLEEVAPAPG